MKTLTVKILNATCDEVAWVSMSSRRQLEVVLPETGGCASVCAHHPLCFPKGGMA
jgi:hypothetical protein